jgi:hypothetical protein
LTGSGSCPAAGTAAAQALIGTRDGIVGSWKAGTTKPDDLPFDNAANMGRWEPWVRASILDFEMFSVLGFTVSGGHKGLLHSYDTTSKTYKLLVGITRPTGHPKS